MVFLYPLKVEMSTILLASKGVQDTFLNGDFSLFKLRYSRHTNFSQAPKMLTFTGPAIAPGETSVVSLQSYGDLVNGVWLSGGKGTNNGPDKPPGLIGALKGTVFELWIGGQMIDSQPFDFIADIWNVYLAENSSKRSHINNFMTSNGAFPQNIDYTFFPLHFFFCDNEMFLPLVSIQSHPVEIRIRWGSSISNLASPVRVYANYIYLDTREREEFIRPMQLLVTQVQRYPVSNPENPIDLSVFNHPVKSLFFGYPSVGYNSTWEFDSADFLINGVYLFEDVPSNYFHTVQGYYHTTNGNIQFGSEIFNSPVTTQYYMYNFCKDATSFKPTGSCNFSQLDYSTLILKNHRITTLPGTTSLNESPFTVYALCYNILTVRDHTAGILFAN